MGMLLFLSRDADDRVSEYTEQTLGGRVDQSFGS